MNPPANLHSALYDPEKTVKSGRRGALTFASKACPPPGTADFIMPASKAARLAGKGGAPGARSAPNRLAMRYSPGDRLNVTVFGAPELSGDYVVNADGRIIFPYTGQIDAVGLTNDELSHRIERALIRGGLYVEGAVKLSVRPVQFAPINVSVSGAVFNAGRQTIGGIRDADKLERALTKFGDNPMERYIPAALRAAGGVRPDADLSAVRVHRNGRTFVLDWRGAITGAQVDDMTLIEGDHVEVPESGCFQSALVRPSQITPPGVRIFTSNLTVPILPNPASGNQQHSNSLPYGARLLQGLVHANCVGGTLATNASRYAVLISRNPKTRETEVVQRSIEELVRSADRDMINPYLMPDDAIACYDSAATDVRDVMSLMSTILTPAQQAKWLR